MTLLAIKYDKGKLQVLDQIKLLENENYIQVKNTDDGWSVINHMQVRGAPAIAIVGCLSLACELYEKNFQSKSELEIHVQDRMRHLVSARPTAVNLSLAAKEMTSLAKRLGAEDVDLNEMKKELIGYAEKMLEKDICDNLAIGDNGAESILEYSLKVDGGGLNDVVVLTHCNTGSLATAGYGTALGVIRSLHARSKLRRVYYTETRPYNQGARLTGYELLHDNIPATLVCDSAVSALMKNKNVTAVVVGADRVAANGDTANKIGTYQLAISAKHHGIPFFVAAPCTSIDLTISSGAEIPIEERPPEEMTRIAGTTIAAPGTQCWNPAFDVTPAHLIAGIVTEKGTFKPQELKSKIE